ncbi:MAG: LacI family DNA-binding transcriptional regulator [Candidatus Neomarinimicrobiota bacterium]
MNKPPHVTLDDIARRLNVSKVTVSKALRDHPDIGPATKREVLAVAEKLGYVPNFIARNLSARKSRTIGLVVPKLAHHFFASCIEAIYNAAYVSQYDIIMTVSQENPEYELKHIQTLLAMRVEGLLISVTENTTDVGIFKGIEQYGVPVVFFDRIPTGIEGNYVVTDDRAAAVRLIDYAIQAGNRKIAHFAGYSHTNIGRERQAGFRQALAENGLTVREEWIIEGGFGEQAGYDAFKQLIAQNDLPELIFAVTFPVALGIYSAAQELGLKIPGDIDVICFGGGQFNRFISPALTYMDQPAGAIGEKAIELLLNELRDPDALRERQIVIPSQLILGETCRKKN